MARTKKAKTPADEKGNAAFNLNDAEPVGDWQAPAAITDEDRELDRELERMAKTEEPVVSDLGPQPMRKINEPYTLLREVFDEYQPAKTINELDDQIFEAKVNGCDSVEATSKLVRYFIKDGSAEKVGYFWYKDVRVYVEGFFEKSSAKDKETMETRLHGVAK